MGAQIHDALFYSEFICVSHMYRKNTGGTSLVVLRLAFISVFQHIHISDLLLDEYSVPRRENFKI